MRISFTDVQQAAIAIGPDLPKTPTTYSRTLSAVTGVKVILKFENQQFTASFKERGALNKLKNLNSNEIGRGVIAVSAGNHAQGVARHAARLNIPATIVMPAFTPFIKIKHTRDLGARVVLEGNNLAEAMVAAQHLQRMENLIFIHPYDDPLIAAGQGTVALEMLNDYPEIDTLVIPIGGGGLITGMAVAAKAHNPNMRVIGVETALYPALYHYLRGEDAVCGGATIAEGIAVKDIGQLALNMARELIDDIILVEEDAIERAVVMLLEIEKTVAEGAGAVGLAALLTNPDIFQGRTVGLVISGGNIDSRLLASIIMRGLVRDRRVVKLRVETNDTPGSLAKIAGLIGAAGGNIIEVNHQRLFGNVAAKSADLDLVIETRDAPHVEEILKNLSQEKFNARLLQD